MPGCNCSFIIEKGVLRINSIPMKKGMTANVCSRETHSTFENTGSL